MSILRSAFNLADLTINVRALGIDKVKSDLAGVQKELKDGMTDAQRRRYQLIQERNELQRTIYEYNRLNRTINMLAKGFVGGFLADRAISGVSAMVRHSMELETAFTALQRTSGLVGGEWDSLQGSIATLAAEMPIAAEATIKTAEAAAQLGIEGSANIAAFTKTIVMLSQSTGLSADKLATDFAKMMNVFQISASESEKYASVLAKLSVVSTATADDILNMTRRIGGASKTMGLGAEQAMALAAATIDIGATAEVGGTAWTNFMMSMMSDTEKWASAIGMAKEELEGLFRADAAGAIETIIGRLSGMGQSDLVAAMAALDIDSTRAQNTMLSLSKAAEKVREHLKTAREELANGDTLAKQFDLTSGTLAAKWQTLTNQVMLLVDAINMTHGPLHVMLDLVSRVVGELSKLGPMDWLIFPGEAPFAAGAKFGAGTDNNTEKINVPNNLHRGQRKFTRQEFDALQAAKNADKAARDAAAREIARDMEEQFAKETGGENALLAKRFGMAFQGEALSDQMDLEAQALKRLADATNKSEEAMRNAVGEMQGHGLGMNVDADQWNLAMQIGNQLAAVPQFQSKFQGVDQLWRGLQTGSLTKKTPEQLAEDQIKQMEKAIEIAKKVENHLVDNGLIIPQVGP